MKKFISSTLLVLLLFGISFTAFAAEPIEMTTPLSIATITTSDGSIYDVSEYVTINNVEQVSPLNIGGEQSNVIDYIVDIPYDILYSLAYADDESYTHGSNQNASFNATIRAVYKIKNGLNSNGISSSGKYINRIEYKYSCPLYNTSVNSITFKAESNGFELTTGSDIRNQIKTSTLSGFTVGVMSNYETGMYTNFNKYIELTDSYITKIYGMADFTVQLGTESVVVNVLADVY